jgi:hypothetical protein
MLPRVNIEGIEQVLHHAERRGQFASLKQWASRNTSREHATRVAWRVVEDWLEAQLALIAAQMATVDEVMLRYLHVDEHRTLWQAYREGERAALTAGSDSS